MTFAEWSQLPLRDRIGKRPPIARLLPGDVSFVLTPGAHPRDVATRLGWRLDPRDTFGQHLITGGPFPVDAPKPVES